LTLHLRAKKKTTWDYTKSTSESFGLSYKMRKLKDQFGQIWQINSPILTNEGSADKKKFNLGRKIQN
jgi:hypothetical protein